MTVALDPLKTAYTPGTFRLTIPGHVWVEHPGLQHVVVERLRRLAPLLDAKASWRPPPHGDEVVILECVSLPWCRRRVGKLFAELVLWLDAWADRHVVGGRMALRAQLGGEAESIHLNQELPF